MIRAGIYRIVDSKSGRFYVGSSVDVDRRWVQHRWRLERGQHPNPILQALWNDDPARLVFSIVLDTAPDRDALLLAEQKALDAAKVGANPMCMNILPVAGSHLGRKRSDVTRQRLRDANLGKRHTAEAKAKQRAAKLGRKLSVEHAAKCVPFLQRGNAARWERDRGKPSEKRALSVAQVIEMRRRRISGTNLTDLAEEFGVSFSTAQRIIAGAAYRECQP